MIAAALFVACAGVYAWLGWRVVRDLRLIDTAGDLPILIAAAYVITATLVVIVTAGLGGFGLLPIRLLSRTPFLLASGAVATLVVLATRGRARPVSMDTAVPPARIWGAAAAITIVVVTIDVALSFAVAPNDWDAMTYHLFLPARWLQQSTIVHVPTAFGDNAGAFAPQNGAVLFAWSMLLLNSDAATNALQIAGLGAIAAAVLYLALRLGASASGAAAAGMFVFLLEPLRAQAYSADVDVWMASFFAVGLAMLVHYERIPRAAVITVAGLATGLAAGTKTIGSTLGLLLFLAATAIALRQRRPSHVAAFVLAAIVAGGFWYVKNLIQYGNPLFPLTFGVGPLRFAGAYGLDAVRAGEFHSAAPGYVVRNAVQSFGIPAATLLMAGAAGLAGCVIESWRSARLASQGTRSNPSGSVAVVLLVAGAAWSLWFMIGVPHNLEARFLLPAAVVLLPGTAVVADLFFRRAPGLGWTIVVAAATGLVATAATTSQWLEKVDTLRATNVAWLPVLCLAVASIGAFATAFALAGTCTSRCRVRAAVGIGALCLIALASLAVESNEDSRVERFARSDFAHWAAAVEVLHDPAMPGSTVAYAGANVPYILTGRRLRHRVVYTNTIGAVDDGFHEHWVRTGRQRFGYHKAGVDRDGGTPATWLANLDRLEPSFLVLFALHPFERRYLDHTADGFPPELEWARENPRRFDPIAGDESTRIFRIVR